MKIDRCAEFIINVLNNEGYSAYLVGGCVRDCMIGRKPKDWDISTNAFPETVYNLFSSLGLTVLDTGAKYGSISVILSPSDIGIITQSDEAFSLKEMNPSIYEITTFRKHSGSRKPRNVEFSDSIEEDLLRRDFTMNAIAYNPQTGIIDVCNGIEDIQNKLIRVVNEPRSKLSEDWLRIMRAIRFQSQLGFNIENNTQYWINRLADIVNNGSVDRIQSEFTKTVQGEHVEMALLNNKKAIGKIFPELKLEMNFEQHNKHHIYDVYTHSVKAIGILANSGLADAQLRIATLFHDIGKPSTYSVDSDGVGHFYKHSEIGALIVEKILRRMNYNINTIDEVSTLVKYHDREIPTKSSVKRLLNKMSISTFKKLLELKHADALAQSDVGLEEKIKELQNARDWLNEIERNAETFKIENLEISGKDLIRLGYIPGKLFSIILNDVFELVLDGDISNTKEELIDYIVNHYKLD